MQVTTRIPTDRLEAYFDAFTKHFLKYESTNAVEAEVLSSELGAQPDAAGAQLLGVTYDPKSDAVELSFEAGQHRVLHPREVWTVEETDGFVRAIEIVHEGGTREVVRVRRLGLRPHD
jgi:hypothetical protein